MSRLRVLAGLLLIVASAGCKAQPSSAPGDLSFNRRVELLVRSKYNVPQDYSVAVGTPSPSSITGYETLPITIGHGGHSSIANFLISSDHKTLARMETFDLDNMAALHIPIDGRPIRGNPDAKVTIINFDDLECPYCARMHQSLFPGTLDHYKGLIRFVYKDFPLTEIHPWAMHAAVDANCLAAQDGTAYWDYVDYLHSHGEEVTGTDRNLSHSLATLDRIARQQAATSKLDAAKLDACLAKQDETSIKAETAVGDSLGIDGTPALFINGERVSGAIPRDQLWMVIDRALRAAGEQPPAQPPAAPAAPPAGQTGGQSGEHSGAAK
ncbi:MAG TPA: thioredoxin domain-containing protein [Terracidiphilus sp.]|nr:thioredoxin domain-containing protein [Terracidiphilus sp.]